MSNILIELLDTVLPCNVGDKLYKPMQAGRRKVIVEYVVISIQSTIKDKWVVWYQNIGSTIRHQCNLSEIGKSIYLTRKEAEQALTCQKSRQDEKGGAE